MKRSIILLFIIVAGINISAANPVRISAKDTTVLRGSTFLYAISADSNLTGLNVTSYEFEINFDPNAIQIQNILSTGTLTAGWGTPLYNIAGNRIIIAAAGIQSLEGTGAMVYMQISTPLNLPHGASGINFIRAMLNEGAPATTTRDGYIAIQPLPVITVNPDEALLTVGNTQQFSISGGTPPYIWSTTNSSIATINSSGLLTAVRHGRVKVVARDQNGIIDTSGQIEIRAFKLSVRDTSYIQGRLFMHPVYVSDLSLVDITSGQFSVSFNPDLMTSFGVLESGTLLQQFGSPTFHTTPGKITISFAGSSRLDGVGNRILIYLVFRPSVINAGTSPINISDLLFNENLLGNIQNGYISISNRNILTVSPQTAILVAKDSLQFSVSGNALPPIKWIVSDTTRAEISTTGMLRAKKSGLINVVVEDFIGAYGTSSSISLFDIRARIVNDSAGVGGLAEIGISTDLYEQGISSAQFKLNFDANYIEPLGVITTGTLSDGWAASGFSTAAGSYSVAAAGSNSVIVSGTLIKVRFRVLPTTPYGSYPINISDVVFNEGIPLSLNFNGLLVVDSRTGIGGNSGILPSDYSLEQNYPNPFNPSTMITFVISQSSFVSLKVYDVLGQEVTNLINEFKNAGKYEVEWNASRIPSGIYNYRLSAGSFSAVKRMMLLR